MTTPVTSAPKTGTGRLPLGIVAVVAVLLTLACSGWWWSVRTSHQDMQALGFLAFTLAWAAMMAAMMFPAIVPVVKLYALAAARGRAAPLPFFVSGYLIVWTALAIPAYFASQALMMPLAEGRPWAARLAGTTLLGAAVWQITALKNLCLRHCRSPLGFFMRLGTGVRTPLGAARAGALHGSICVGCCWALMAVLVAFGTMNLAWMAGLAGLIFVEKNAPHGEWVARSMAPVFLALGALLLLHPGSITALV